jgi:NAD(P)H-hydrate epimerase
VPHCEPGNNGGDGLGAARHLHNGGALVRIVLAGHPREYRGDAKINYEIVRAMGIPRVAPDAVPRRPDLVIDALLGTGLSRAVEEPIAALIERINGRRRGVKVLSIDIPSGMDADSGEALGVAVRADVTVSLVGWKVGFLNKGAKEHLGKVVVVGIGVPRELEERLGEER